MCVYNNWVLQNSALYKHKFWLFHHSDQKSALGIAGFGVSVTTMEEVFLRVKDGSDESIDSRFVIFDVCIITLYMHV